MACDFYSIPMILASAGVLHPAAIIALCVIAGVGTVLLLPAKRERSIARIGGAVLAGSLLLLLAVLARMSAETSPADVYFYVFSSVALVGAIRVISHPRPVYSALYFVLTVFASAGLFVLLWAEFMAAALVLIYAGAILVTYVFVIMLATQVQTGKTGAEAEGAEYDRTSREPLVACIVGFALMGVLLFAIFDAGNAVPKAGTKEPGNRVADLGRYLFADQLISLEVAGVILTISVVGAIIIARRQVDESQTTASAESTQAIIGDDNPHALPIAGHKSARHGMEL